MKTAEAQQIDLFTPPLLPGLDYAVDFLSKAEEAGLIEHINAAPLTPFRFQQWTGKRLTTGYGWTYDFENGHFGPTDPMPDWLLRIRDRAARFAGLAPERLIQALLIRYDIGAGIGWTVTARYSIGSLASRSVRTRRCASGGGHKVDLSAGRYR